MVSLLLKLLCVSFVLATLTPTLPVVLTTIHKLAEKLESAVTTVDQPCCPNKFTDNINLTLLDAFNSVSLGLLNNRLTWSKSLLYMNMLFKLLEWLISLA